MNTMSTITTTILILVLVGHATAASLGVYPINLCPSNSSNATSASPYITWKGAASPTSQPSCAAPLEPTSQAIFVNSLVYAQQNKPQYVPRSNTYALSVLRAATVATVYLDFEITDAAGKTLVPRTQIHLQPTPLTVSPMNPQVSSRRTPSDAGSYLPGRLSEDTPTTIPKGKHRGHPAAPFRGRRKGKGGIMGGIGGGGRYGGGTGGFRATGGSTKSYGYSSSAMNARYAPGYSRTGYGYHGRSVMFIGAPMYLFSRGHHGAREYYSGCSQYTGAQQTRCQSYYSSCRYGSTSNYSACYVKASSQLIRDDIMAASIDSTKAVFPLNITVYQVNTTFKSGSEPDPWTNPVLLTFSEVDFDDENDADMEFWVFCLLMSLAIIAVCCGGLFIWSVCCDGECCECKCCWSCNNAGSDTENHPVSRTNSKVLEEVDLEAQGGTKACMVHDANEAAPTTTIIMTGYYPEKTKDAEA